MNSQSNSLNQITQNQQYSQLIKLLKGIILDQENRIYELEQQLKKWQIKYKAQFYKEKDENKQNKNNKNSQILHLNNQFFSQFYKQQQKYNKGSHKKNHQISHSQSFKNILLQFQMLHQQVQDYQTQINQKIKIINDQIQTIKQQNIRHERMKTQFKEIIKKSQNYEEKLLNEIKKLQKIVNENKLKQLNATGLLNRKEGIVHNI